MALSSGRKLGSYEVVEPIGAGGMGEVYRALDTKLKRDVALKVVPDYFLSDAQRMARFEREAQLLAALNHANIAAIYGIEESDGVRALVMELVEGPTLAERIALSTNGDSSSGTPIPLDEALAIAKQIAEALEYAHERGIIHRDLKPANVKVKADGAVKVLDFGLAKALADDPAASDISNSPTLSVAATRAGFILGTAAYMAPEQARGKSVDRRADIWSFGVVFYEMLTGEQLFPGETASDSLAAVITRKPDWDALPKNSPARIRQLLQRCLEKDPRRRLQAIGEARYAIEEAIANPGEVEAPASAGAAATAPFWQRVVPWAAAVLFAFLAVVAYWRPWTKPNPGGVVRLSADFGAEGSLSTVFGPSAVLSPDGTRIAFVLQGVAGRKTQIFLRSLDQSNATALAGTEGARDPFFSPDSQWIAFFADGKLKKVSVQGGAAVSLCEAQEPRGGAWGEDGTIVFAPNPRAGLSRVSSGGGTPTAFSTLDRGGEITHRWPQFLPGSKAVLFTSSGRGGNFEDSDAVVEVVATGQKKKVLQGGFYVHYLPSGHLVYMHEDTLFAAPFDLKRLEVTGQTMPVLEQVMNNDSVAGAQFSFSQTGLFVYVPGKGSANSVSIYWMGSDGKTQALREMPGLYFSPAFSPDGKFLALSIATGHKSDIWVYSWERDTLTRLTFADSANNEPAWTPDGKRIAYGVSEDSGLFNISWKRADGAGDAQRLIEGKYTLLHPSWSPDGKTMAFVQVNPDTSGDIMTLSLEGGEETGWKAGPPRPFLNTPFGEYFPSFSPDGHWLAYMSNESGTYEVYVRPFPGPGGKWQISTGGGWLPQWSRNGKELFYRTLDQKVMVAGYAAIGDSFRAEKPKIWSDIPIAYRGNSRNYALHPDGKRIAFFKIPGEELQSRVTKATFVFNFFDEIRRKLAVSAP